MKHTRAGPAATSDRPRNNLQRCELDFALEIDPQMALDDFQLSCLGVAPVLFVTGAIRIVSPTGLLRLPAFAETLVRPTWRDPSFQAANQDLAPRV